MCRLNYLFIMLPRHKLERMPSVCFRSLISLLSRKYTGLEINYFPLFLRRSLFVLMCVSEGRLPVCLSPASLLHACVFLSCVRSISSSFRFITVEHNYFFLPNECIVH